MLMADRCLKHKCSFEVILNNFYSDLLEVEREWMSAFFGHFSESLVLVDLMHPYEHERTAWYDSKNLLRQGGDDFFLAALVDGRHNDNVFPSREIFHVTEVFGE